MNKIEKYYREQVAFYAKRVRQAEKTLSDFKSLGLDDQNHLDFLGEALSCERRILKLYTNKLETTK